MHVSRNMCSDPVVYDEVEKAVYEELWDQARTLTDSEFKNIQRSISIAVISTATFLPTITKADRYLLCANCEGTFVAIYLFKIGLFFLQPKQ